MQLAIFFVWRSSGDDETNTEEAEISVANTQEAPSAAGNPTGDLDTTTPTELPDTEVKPAEPEDEGADTVEGDPENDPEIEEAATETDPTAVGEPAEEPETAVAPTPTTPNNFSNKRQPKETRRQRIAREREKNREREREKNERKRAAAEAERAVASAPVEPKRGKLSISTNPSGATVALDGVFIGKSPIRDVDVAPGRHSVALSLNGYEVEVVAVRVSAGSTKNISEGLKRKKVAAVASTVPTETASTTLTVAARLPRTPRVSGMGSVSAGKGILGSKCNGCHRKSGASGVGPKSRTSKQWEKFFARGSHDRYRRIGGDMSSGQIASVKAYLMSKSADKDRNQGAGIR